MRINDLCSFSDQYYIAECKEELNKKYVSSSEVIYTDGTNTRRIDEDGYIHIENVDAEYIIFIDRDDKVYLGIYKYIQDSKHKEIIDELKMIRLQNKNMSSAKNQSTNNIALDDIIDINNMVCTECGSKDLSKFSTNTSTGEIECTCKVCKTKFKLVPSKYFVIKSKTIFMDTKNAAHLN